MEDARSRSAKMLDEYTAALEEAFTEHQQNAIRRAEQQVELEKKQIERETNKKLSLEQINIRREFGKKQDELKEKLFQELLDRLTEYRKTPEYKALLNNQARKALELADKDFITIYIDPQDEEKLKDLSIPQSAELLVSEYSFMGGIRAVIPARHILIDNSFQTKLSEAKRDFRFDIKDIMGGEAND